MNNRKITMNKDVIISKLREYLLGGMDYKTISVELGKSIGALQSLKFRHLKHLGDFRFHSGISIHGDSGGAVRLYNIWKGMKQRCYSEKNIAYRHYGGKGIIICKDWHKYVNFKIWSLANGYTDKLTIDRINNNGNYEPGNCQWITRGKNSAKSVKPNLKLTNSQVIELKHLHITGNFTQSELSSIFSISPSNISCILANKTYKEV